MMEMSANHLNTILKIISGCIKICCRRKRTRQRDVESAELSSPPRTRRIINNAKSKDEITLSPITAKIIQNAIGGKKLQF